MDSSVDWWGGDFSNKNYSVMVQQMCKSLNTMHSVCVRKQVDFDLLAVSLMQGIDHTLHIRDIIGMVLDQFGHQFNPPTSPDRSTSAGAPKNQSQQLDHQIHHAALSVQITIQHYDQTPMTCISFCLRHPTYLDVLSHSIEMERKCKILPAKGMVVLTDEAGICVGVGIPPIPLDKDNLWVEYDRRALNALNGMVGICKWNSAKDEIVYSQSPPLGPLQTPRPIDMINKGETRDPKPKSEALGPLYTPPINTTKKGDSRVQRTQTTGKTTISFQQCGFGLGDIKLTGMQDLKIPSDKKGIKSIELEGHGIGWKTPIVKPSLPTPPRDSPNAADNREMVQIRNEMCYYSTLSLWINKAFLPQSVSVAEKAVKYLLEDGCNLLKQNLAFEKNQVIASRTITIFYFPVDLKEPPRQFSVAFWSQESSFSSVGRVAAYKSENKVFNLSEYWIPFYPKYDPHSVQEELSLQKRSSRIRSRHQKNQPDVSQKKSQSM
ncbi:hypothetical protein H4Q26_017915 [Puccinia striiformis f. sp. tritici PST-130]|nr:hypothetical protein H4Q26_017915 [Puccinia striiformis f. sp. tritici PST-130]